MRILFSITNLHMGGAQTFLVSLVNEMAKYHSVFIYCLCQDQVTEEIDSRISPKIKRFYFPDKLARIAPHLQKLFSLIKKSGSALPVLKRFHLKWLVWRLRIGIIHSQLFHSDEFVSQTFADSKLPVLITEHGCYNYVVQQGFTNPETVSGIFNRANGLAYISGNNLRHIIEITGNNGILSRKFNNGIPRPVLDKELSLKLADSLHINSNDFVFGMVARGIKEKGWDIAIGAFEALQATITVQVHLILIGDSPYLQELKKQVEDRCISNIYFLGSLPEPIHWINRFDAGLLPSYFAGESVPMTVIEYLACNTPVIATNVGNIKEMVTVDGRSAGIIFDYHQDFMTNVGNLSEAMARYITDPELLKQHRAATARCFSRFDIEHVAREYSDFYTFIRKRNTRS